MAIVGQCYDCYETKTFEYHGFTGQYDSEMKRYIDSLYDGAVVSCVTCGVTTRFRKDDLGRYTPEVIE